MSLRRRLREHGLDGVTLLVLPGVVFVLALFIYPFLYGLVLSFTPKQGGWLANYQKFFSDPFLYDTIYLTLQIAVPVTLAEHRAVGAGRAARAADEAAEAADHDPGDPDHAGHGDGGRGAADLSRSTRLAEPVAAGIRPGRQPGAADPQLLGRDAVAGDHRLSVHLPADAVLCHRHRPVAGTGRRDAGRAGAAAVLPHPAAAAGAGAGDHPGAGVRAGVHRVPLRRFCWARRRDRRG